MSAVINLRREPKLREQFEYAQVVNNTVLIDRRTRWGNPFRVTEAGLVCRGRRALPRPSLAAHPGGRGDAGGPCRARRLLAGVLVRRRRPSLPRRGARTGGSLGGAGAGGAVRWMTRRRAHSRTPCQAEPPMGSVQVERNSPLRDLPLCHACSGQQPCGSSGRCAPCGLTQEALGRTVKVADREDRGAIFRTKIGNFPHQLRPRASRARCSPCARVTQRNITSGRNAPIAATRS